MFINAKLSRNKRDKSISKYNRMSLGVVVGALCCGWENSSSSPPPPHRL